MGNACVLFCDPYNEEAHKRYDDETDEAESHSFHSDDDDAYDHKAKGRERQISIHARARRQPITCTPLEFGPEFAFTAPSFPKSPETTEFILESMGKSFVFDSIGEETKLQFVNAMQPQEYDEGEWVIRQGDDGDYFYIVEEGEVAIHLEGSGELVCVRRSANYVPPLVGTESRGYTFGELALLYNTPRAASIRASTPLKLYRIGQLTFRSLLMSNQVQDRCNLLAQVKEVYLFQDFDDGKLGKLVDAFTTLEFRAGQRIVNKGDYGNVFYIVKSGQVKVEDIGQGSSVYTDHFLNAGEYFGERALITSEPRAANVSAVTPSSLLAISKGVLEDIIGPVEQATRHSCLILWLSSIPIFVHLKRDEIDRCVRQLKKETFKKGDKISTTQEKLYLIDEGLVLITTQQEADNEKLGQHDKNVSTGPKLVKFENGDYFLDSWGKGEKASQSNVMPDEVTSESTINVEADTKCVSLLMSDVEKVVGDMKRLSFNRTASKSRISFALTESEKKRGRKYGSKPTFLKSMQFGSAKFNLIKVKRSTPNRNVLNLSKVDKHRILGVGTFGKVWLVTPKSNERDEPTPYALKMVSKRQVLQQKMAATILREKNILESIDHPLLIQMVSSFQDADYLYFVMGLILGGELFTLMFSKGKEAISDNAVWKESAFYKSFGEEDERPINGLGGVGIRKAVFFSACVIEAFAYLHERRIVYRDLKPENVMLNQKGYCVIVDMGFAKVVLDKTYTMCGTPEYLAPEIISYKGHNHVVDYWSFACLMYELIVGQTPFFNKDHNQMSLLKAIAKADYSFPDEIDKLSPDGSNGLDRALCDWKDVVSCLLKANPVERLGNLRNGIEDIVYHDWFANIDFNELRNQGMPAPWIPLVAHPLDTSHFKGRFGKHERPEVFRRKLSSHDQAIFKAF